MAGAADLARALGEVPGVAVRLSEPVSRHGALRLGGEVEAWVVVNDELGLRTAVTALRRAELTIRPSFPLGDAYAREEGLSGALLRLGPAFGRVELCDGELRIGGAAPLAMVGSVAREAGLEGWARLESWPGTLAGWMANVDPVALGSSLVGVRVFQGRGFRDVEGPAVGSLARNAILLSARLDAMLGPDFVLPPPPPPPGAFCVLGPELVGYLARSRLPGMRLRRIRLSEEHAGIVVNLGGGSSRDLDLVLELTKRRLFRDHGLEVQTRLQPIGKPPRPRNKGKGAPR